MVFYSIGGVVEVFDMTMTWFITMITKCAYCRSMITFLFIIILKLMQQMLNGIGVRNRVHVRKIKMLWIMDRIEFRFEGNLFMDMCYAHTIGF